MSNRRIDGNILDSFVLRNSNGESISSITFSVDNETDERIQADANLQSQIDDINQIIEDNGINTNERIEILEEEVEQLQIDLTTETNNRIIGDINLQNNITTEINNRISGDNNLQNNIVAETNNRISADSNLQNNIVAETNNRINADSNLQNNIVIETNNRINADSNLQNNIVIETNNRISADSILQNNIVAETNNRISADINLQSQITTLSNNTTYTTTVIIKEYNVVSNVYTWTGRYKFNVKPSTNEEIYDLKYFNDSINTINDQIVELNDDTADLYDKFAELDGDDPNQVSTRKLFGAVAGIGIASGLMGAALFSVAGKINFSELGQSAFDLTERLQEFAQDTADNMRRGQRIRLPDADDADGDVEMEFFEDDPLLPEQNAGMRFGAFGGSFL